MTKLSDIVEEGEPCPVCKHTIYYKSSGKCYKCVRLAAARATRNRKHRYGKAQKKYVVPDNEAEFMTGISYK